MSRIFLSHSSADELPAVALKQWLTDNGWDDVFLDVDPQRGLAAGERWQEALRRAADRCEAVLFVVSPAWAKSKWCLAEFLLAKNLHKLIFGIVLKDIPIGELPTEMTAEWQLCHLSGQGPTDTIRFTHRDEPAEIAFLADGLKRLRSGLQGAGLSASFFPWPPRGDESRSPYRGLEALDAQDAAVFFGRDAEILQGLDRLRGMRAVGDEGLFVILGGSGAGKSSFLRAGLLPRLARDDRHFFPLEVIRPERSPLFGVRGLASALSKANSQLQITPVNPGDLKSALKEGPERFSALLRNIQNAVQARIITLPDDAPRPTLVLPIDQAEELFNADAAEEAHEFLELIGAVLRNALTNRPEQRVPMIVAFTIRSDRYEFLQVAAELVGLKTVLFDALRPMPSSQFKEVITGPAGRASVDGQRVELRPDLVNQLLDDCAKGADTLPLLALTLARLYRDYGSDGDLRLDEYTRMGGMADVIKTEAESILDADLDKRKAQLEWLHAAFIPGLATINTDNDQPMRRVARMSELPKDSRPLVQKLIEKRLLLSEMRGEEVVEVASESLLRQWKVLADWLKEEREDLKGVDRLEREAKVWMENGKKEAWLIAGERLTVAEALLAKPAYHRRLEPVSEFLLASRQREAQRQAEEERVRQAELIAAQEKQAAAESLAAEQQRATKRARAFGLVIGLLFLAAGVGAVLAVLARNSAETAQQQAEGLAGFLLGEQFLGEIRDVGRSTMLEQVQSKAQSYENDHAQKAALIRGLALRNTGDIERMHGELRKSISSFDQALKAIESGPNNIDRTRETARTRELLGNALADQGHVTEALEHYEAAVNGWGQVTTSSAVKVNDCTSFADSLVSAGELKNRMGKATLASKDLQDAIEIASTVLFGHRTSHKGCEPIAGKVEPSPDAKALEVLSHALLLRAAASLYANKEDNDGALRLAIEAKRLRPVSASATRQKATALAFLANSTSPNNPQLSLEKYREVLAEFNELRRRDPSNRLWERELAAVQLLITEGIVACHQSKTKDCKPLPALEEADTRSSEVIGTLRALAQTDSSNMSLQRDLGWAWQNRAKVLEARGQQSERLAALKTAELFYRNSILDHRSDVEGVIQLGTVLLDQSKALADRDQWPEAKATLQRSIGSFEKLEKEVGAQEDNLGILGYLMNVKTEEGKLLRKAGDQNGADLADRALKRLEEQYNNLIDRSGQESTKLYASHIKSKDGGAKLFKEGNLAAAIPEFNAAESSMREYIRLKPSAFGGYDNLRKIYDRIQATQEKLEDVGAQGAALLASLRAAQIAAWLESDDPGSQMHKNLHNAQENLGIFLNDKGRYDEALAMVQEEVVVAEALVQRLSLDQPKPGDPNRVDSLWRLGTAKFGLGLVRRNLKKEGWQEAIRSAFFYIQKAADIDRRNFYYPKKLGEYRKYLADELDADRFKEEALVEYRLALKAYEQAASLSPDDEDALQGIRKLAELGIR